MPARPRPVVALFAALAITAAAMPGCSHSGQRAIVPASTSTTVPAGTTVSVDASTSNGRLVITQDPTAGGARVTAEAKLVNQDRADRFTVEARLTDAGVLVVRPVWPDGERLNNEKCSIEIVAPTLRDVLAVTSNGSVHLTGGQGTARIETSNGAVAVAQRDGDTLVRTRNGRIEVDDSIGALDLGTSNGAIRIARTAPADGPSPVNWRAATSNGGITLDLDQLITARIRASTSNGKVTVERKSVPGQDARVASGRTLEIGDGPGEIVLTTSNGAIRVGMP